MKRLMGDVFLEACSNCGFLGLPAALDTGKLLAAACTASVRLGACCLSLVAAAAFVVVVAGAGVLLCSVLSAPVAMGLEDVAKISTP